MHDGGLGGGMPAAQLVGRLVHSEGLLATEADA